MTCKRCSGLVIEHHGQWRYRDKERVKQRNRRARLKGASNAASLHGSEHELSRSERDHQDGEGAPDGLQQPQKAMG